MRLGIVVIPLNPGFKFQKFEYLINDSDPSLIIGDQGKKEQIGKINSKILFLSISTSKYYNDLECFKLNQCS